MLYKDQSFYHVICGERGTGKTTLIRSASREVGQDEDKGIQGGKGVIYVEIPADAEVKLVFKTSFEASNFFKTFKTKNFFSKLISRHLVITKR